MMIVPFMHLGTEDSDVEIRKEDLTTITDRQLKKWCITRDELARRFAEAMELMQGATQEDWAKGRPVCVQHLNGEWEVGGPVGYNQYTHPLMHGPTSGNA